MRIVKKNVYYCEYCNKRGLSAGHMRNHEKHCTVNPNRYCKVCDSQFHFSDIIEDFKSRYKIVESKSDSYPFVEDIIKWTGKEITMNEIDNHADGCPACKLAIIRQSGLTHYLFIDILRYDYKQANAEYWKKRNDEEARTDMYGSY